MHSIKHHVTVLVLYWEFLIIVLGLWKQVMQMLFSALTSYEWKMLKVDNKLYKYSNSSSRAHLHYSLNTLLKIALHFAPPLVYHYHCDSLLTFMKQDHGRDPHKHGKYNIIRWGEPCT